MKETLCQKPQIMPRKRFIIFFYQIEYLFYHLIFIPQWFRKIMYKLYKYIFPRLRAVWQYNVLILLIFLLALSQVRGSISFFTYLLLPLPVLGLLYSPSLLSTTRHSIGFILPRFVSHIISNFFTLFPEFVLRVQTTVLYFAALFAYLTHVRWLILWCTYLVTSVIRLNILTSAISVLFSSLCPCYHFCFSFLQYYY